MDNSQSSKVVWLIAVLLLLAGIAMGYFYGFSKGKEKGFAEGKEAEIKSRQELLTKASGITAVNPATNLPETNPFEGAKTNPFKDTYTNPFK